MKAIQGALKKFDEKDFYLHFDALWYEFEDIRHLGNDNEEVYKTVEEHFVEVRK